MVPRRRAARCLRSSALIGYRSVTSVTYTDLLGYLKDGKIAEVSIIESLIEGRFKTRENGAEYFITRRVDPALAKTSADAGVSVNGDSDSNWLTTILSWIVPMLVFVGLWFFVFRDMAARSGHRGLTAIGQSKAKIYIETKTGVSFSDVAGIDEAKAELQEIVSFLK